MSVAGSKKVTAGHQMPDLGILPAIVALLS